MGNLVVKSLGIIRNISSKTVNKTPITAGRKVASDITQHQQSVIASSKQISTDTFEYVSNNGGLRTGNPLTNAQTRFEKTGVTDFITKKYVAQINKVPVFGITREELPILNMVHESMLNTLKATKGKYPLYDKIVFEHVRPNGIPNLQGVACYDYKTRTLRVNKDYFENIDKNINENLQQFIDSGLITKDKSGKYRILDFLRNSKSETFEKRLNEYNKNWSLQNKFLFHRVSMNYYANLTYQVNKSPIYTIERIMQKGNNQQLLKKMGLFKTRSAVMQMNTKEQLAYLKSIGGTCPPPVDTCLVTYPNFLFNHEAMHNCHFENISDKLIQELYSPSKTQEWLQNKNIQQMAAKVSGYSGTHPMEFVAEVGAGLINNQKFDKDVISLYKYLKGPEI